MGAGAPELDGSFRGGGASPDGALPPGGDGDGLEGDVTTTEPTLRFGSAPFAVSAWKVIVHDPAGRVVVAVQVPLIGVPAVSDSGTARSPKVAVTPDAALPAVER